MDDVVRALGWSARLRHRALLVGYIVALSGAFTIGGYALARPLGPYLWVVELVLWLPWLAWLGYFFPRHHLRAVASGRPTPYRRAFFVHVAPGISWNFAQMARPGLAGLAGGDLAHLHPVPVVAGLGAIAVGGVAIGLALRAIGVSRALFLGEYDESSRTLVTSSIYAWLRHPLFVGGVVVSLGFGMFFFSYDALTMAAANAAVLPVYRAFEDARCGKVHRAYRRYRHEVSGVVPALAQTRRIWARVKAQP